MRMEPFSKAVTHSFALKYSYGSRSLLFSPAGRAKPVLGNERPFLVNVHAMHLQTTLKMTETSPEANASGILHGRIKTKVVSDVGWSTSSWLRDEQKSEIYVVLTNSSSVFSMLGVDPEISGEAQSWCGKRSLWKLKHCFGWPSWRRGEGSERWLCRLWCAGLKRYDWYGHGCRSCQRAKSGCTSVSLFYIIRFLGQDYCFERERRPSW